MFRRMPIGEMMWNLRATSGSAASQITVEATTPSIKRAPARRSRVRHQGSNRRSSSSSGERGPYSRPRMASPVDRTRAHAGGTSQNSAAIARNES